IPQLILVCIIVRDNRRSVCIHRYCQRGGIRIVVVDNRRLVGVVVVDNRRVVCVIVVDNRGFVVVVIGYAGFKIAVNMAETSKGGSQFRLINLVVAEMQAEIYSFCGYINRVSSNTDQ